MTYEFNLLYYINIYKKWWRKIVIVMVLSIFLTFCFLLFTPTIYISTITTISATEGGDSLSSLGKLLGLSSGGSSSINLVTAILRCRHMTKDINEKFEMDKNPKWWWNFNIRSIPSGFAIDVKGPDPALTEKIANFCIENLDKINTELGLTTAKPMVKVLDPATYGSREPKQTQRKLIVAGLISFIACTIYIFSNDYIQALKKKD